MTNTSLVGIWTLASSTDEEEALRLTARRRSWFRRLRASKEPEILYPLWWPIDVLSSSALVKLPFRKPQRVVNSMAWDAVTGRLGIIDIPMPDAVIRQVSPELVLQPVAADVTLDNDWYEMLRNHLVRRYKPSSLPDLNLESRRRVHIPYYVAEMGDVTYLVDSMLNRADRLDDVTAGRQLQTESGLLL